MTIDPTALKSGFPSPARISGEHPVGAAPQEAGGASFSDSLKSALDEVSQMQARADDSVTKFASGEIQDIHQVMVAFEQARLSMQLLVETRNKLVEAYQEVSRIQI